MIDWVFRFDEEKRERKKELFERRVRSAAGRAVAVACVVAETHFPGHVEVCRIPKGISKEEFDDGREGAIARDENCDRVDVRVNLGGNRVVIELSRSPVYKNIPSADEWGVDDWDVVRADLFVGNTFGTLNHRGTWRSVGVERRLVKEDQLLAV